MVWTSESWAGAGTDPGVLRKTSVPGGPAHTWRTGGLGTKGRESHQELGADSKRVLGTLCTEAARGLLRVLTAERPTPRGSLSQMPEKKRN